MTRKLEREQLSAEVASLEAMLRSLPLNDLVGRIGFESRLEEVRKMFAEIDGKEERQASIALYFGGEPVVGSRGIQAEFGASVVSNYQDVIAKVWATLAGGDVSLRGQIRDKDAAQLHITNLVHGSFGFLLEELDQEGEPLFTSPLKEAADKATEYMLQFADVDEQPFIKLTEEINPRVFTSIRNFLRPIYRDNAVFRLVEGEVDRSFDRQAVERAYNRAEATEIDDQDLTVEGELIGVVPYARRFEFRTYPGNELVSGKVAQSFGQSYLERMHQEQLVGRRWHAVLRRRETKKPGQTSESFTLIDLRESLPTAQT
jgi:hypothetical protein